MNDTYDIIIAGSGFTGSTLALVLGRLGMRVLVLEKRAHPRFALGEVTIPAGSDTVMRLAIDYDIPELAKLIDYFGLQELDCASYPKHTLYYAVHRQGAELEARDEFIAETLPLPFGPDVQHKRADTDAVLAQCLPSYGVDYLDHTEIVDFEYSGSIARLTIRSSGGERELRGKYVVDASGRGSFFARHFELRDARPRMHSDTRAIFGHFTGVADLDELIPANPDHRFKRKSGTMHHCFPGGWMWVIPFNDGVTSVGLVLDRNTYPENERSTPEEELRHIAARFPTIARHISAATAVTQVTRTGRLQYSSRTILGDGFILTPPAAGFVSPYASPGIAQSMSFIARLVPLLEAAWRADDYRKDRFTAIEQAVLTEFTHLDQLISGTYASFRHPDLFKVFLRTLIVGAALEYVARVLCGPYEVAEPTYLFGAGFGEFAAAVAAMSERVRQNHEDDAELARQLHRMYAAMETVVFCPSGLCLQGDWGTGASRGAALWLNVLGLEQVLEEYLARYPALNTPENNARVGKWVAEAEERNTHQIGRYHRDPDFREQYRFITGLQAPGFDYLAYFGLAAALTDERAQSGQAPARR